jgi:hypothetical protein
VKLGYSALLILKHDTDHVPELMACSTSLTDHVPELMACSTSFTDHVHKLMACSVSSTTLFNFILMLYPPIFGTSGQFCQCSSEVNTFLFQL